MLVALAAAVVVWMMAPAILPWLSPVLCGLILAIPLSVLLSSVSLGQALARQGLLVIPAETEPPPVLQRLRQLLGAPAAQELSDTGALFRRAIADPAFAALHRSILLATGAQRKAEPRQVRRAEKQLRAGALHRLSDEDRKAVLSDPSALASLHLSLWTNTINQDQVCAWHAHAEPAVTSHLM
jgi:membrane glycosyltransferase